MSFTEQLKNKDTNELGDSLYALSEIRQQSTELINVHPAHWLALKFDKDSFWLKFALFGFSQSDLNSTEENTKVYTVFEGEGPTGSLREMRHIYWGEDGKGYIFYLPGNAVIKSLEYLKKYYDME